MQFGNLRARYRSEQVRQAMDVAVTAHARLAESELPTAMVTGSTAVTSGELVGATRDVVATLDRAVASLRARHRLDRRSPIRCVAPSWVLDMIRADAARETRGVTAERPATADAEVERRLAARAIDAVWTLDWPSTMLVVAQRTGGARRLAVDRPVLALPGGLVAVPRRRHARPRVRP